MFSPRSILIKQTYTENGSNHDHPVMLWRIVYWKLTLFKVSFFYLKLKSDVPAISSHLSDYVVALSLAYSLSDKSKQVVTLITIIRIISDQLIN